MRVSNPSGQSANTSADDYSFGAPRVTSLSPTGGPAGTTVTIFGTGFTGVQNVKFVGNSTNKTATILNINPDYTSSLHAAPQAITVTAPTGLSGTVDVIVTTDAGASADTANDDYSYGIPTITSIVPAAGKTAGGTTVVINGTNFDGSCTVAFDDVTLDSGDVTINSESKITVVSPAFSALASYPGDPVIDVVVTNRIGLEPDGSAHQVQLWRPDHHFPRSDRWSGRRRQHRQDLRQGLHRSDRRQVR